MIGYATRGLLVIVIEYSKFSRFFFHFFSPDKYLFNLHLLTLLMTFLSDNLSDYFETIRPYTLKGFASWAIIIVK